MAVVAAEEEQEAAGQGRESRGQWEGSKEQAVKEGAAQLVI